MTVRPAGPAAPAGEPRSSGVSARRARVVNANEPQMLSKRMRRKKRLIFELDAVVSFVFKAFYYQLSSVHHKKKVSQPVSSPLFFLCPRSPRFQMRLGGEVR
jgi:hypothetical protein